MIARSLFLALGGLVLAAIAIRIPASARTGLDAAWSLALSVAHTNHLVFGREIAFTFGPLGYLISGVATAGVIYDIARFSGFVAAFYALVTCLALAAPMSLTQRIVLATMLFLLAASPSGGDYLLLFAFLAALGARTLRTPRTVMVSALALGTIAGIAAMTKFTLAIDCGGAGALFYFGSALFARRVHQLRWIAAGLTFGAGFAAAALASFAPNPLAITFTTLAIGAAVGACLGRGIPRAILAAGALALTLIGIVISTPEIIDFTRISLAAATDYSSAMSQPGSTDQLRFAIGELAIISFLIIALATEGNVALATALAFALFGGFKHGYVRQDGHVFYFAITAAAVATVAYAALRRPAGRRLGIVPVFVAGIALFSVTQSAIGTSVLAGASLSRIAENITFLASVPELARQLDFRNSAALAGERLPDQTIARFGQVPVDVEPTDATVAIASGLNWKPVPGLQAYSAYDRTIDDLNTRSLSNRAAGFVLYSWASIDGRYPFSDSPGMMAVLACQFRADGTLAPTKDGGAAIVLAGPTANRCGRWRGQDHRTVRFGAPISIEYASRSSAQIVRLSVRTTYSLSGRIRKALFRVGDLFITMTYDDGTTAKFRIIPEAAAIGMIVDPSPRGFDETRAFFSGTLLPHVRSVAITTDVPATFEPTLDIRIENAVRRT